MPIERDQSCPITEDRETPQNPRADYAWPTKDLARVLRVHPNRAADWWYRTRRKLRTLAMEMPGETGQELIRLMARRK